MIPAILKGDTPLPISVVVPDALATLQVTYQGVAKVWRNVSAGATVSLQFTAAETEAFELGTFPLEFVGINAAGQRKTYPAQAKVKITDCPGMAYSGTVELPGTGMDIGNLGSDDSIGKVKQTVNALMAWLRGGTAFALLMSISAMAEVAPLYTSLNDMPGNALIMTNVAEYVAGNAGGGGGGGVDTNAVNDLIVANALSRDGDTAIGSNVWSFVDVNNGVTRATNSVAISPYGIKIAKDSPSSDLGSDNVSISPAGLNIGMGSVTFVNNERSTVSAFGLNSLLRVASGELFEVEYPTRGGTLVVDSDVQEIENTVNAWQNYWGGDDVRVTVTNYYGAVDIPSLYIEQKMQADDTHDSSWFKTIWDERTRWGRFLAGYTAISNAVANDLADRAWGVYDSSSGAYSPDGLLQISQEQIMIASGMAYQKTITTGGCAVWVLKSTSPTTISGVSSNGFFRIEDGDGNALFEIVKGDKRVVGATATGLEMQGNVMSVRYDSVSDEHPTMEICTDLTAGDWQTETATTAATVSWSGSSGAWVATVTPVGARPALFVKATYEAGGNTYIKNNVASSLDKVVVGGIEYTVTVETINGKKLMVLQ